MKSLHKILINLAKNIDYFRSFSVFSYTMLFSLLFCFACTDTALKEDQVHQAAKTAISSIDSIETQIHSDTPSKQQTLDKDVHATTPTIEETPGKDVHAVTPAAEKTPDKDAHATAPATKETPDKDAHTAAPATKETPDKDAHTVAPATGETSDKNVHADTPNTLVKPDKDSPTNSPTILEIPDEESLFKSYLSWAEFFITALGLFILYFVLRFGKQILTNTQYLGSFRLPLLSSIERILIFYEPIVILLLGGACVLVNPLSHGMWVALLFIGGFSHVQNYISGRILQLDKGISIGNRIKVDNQKGVISAIDRLGIQMTTDKGTQYLNYSKLSDGGFMLLSGEEVGGNYTLKIRPKEYNERLNYPAKLMDIFTTTPFLDWSHRPKIGTPSGDQHSMNVKVMVREDAHLPDLMQMIEERGYVCSIK